MIAMQCLIYQYNFEDTRNWRFFHMFEFLTKHQETIFQRDRELILHTSSTVSYVKLVACVFLWFSIQWANT